MGGEIKINFDFFMYIFFENFYIFEKNRIKLFEKKIKLVWKKSF